MFRKCCVCNRCCCNRIMDKFDITMEELKQMVNRGALLIDVRSPQEYNEGHLEGAIVLPDYEVRKKINMIVPDKNKTIVVYCDTGIRSKNVNRFLRKIGYINVYNLYKGTQNY